MANEKNNCIMLLTVIALSLTMLTPLSGCGGIDTKEPEPDVALPQEDHVDETPDAAQPDTDLTGPDTDPAAHVSDPNPDSDRAPDPGPDSNQIKPPPEEVVFSARNYSLDTPVLDLSLLNLKHDEVAQLQYMTNMTELRLWGNQIDDLTPLSGQTGLVDLSLGNNKISDLTPLAGLTNLTRLNLYGNQISDLTPISGLTNLTDLILSNNQIVDLTPLAGLTNLKFLELENNRIGDMTPLSSLTGLEELALNGNQIMDISSLSSFDTLRFLSISDNPLSESTSGDPDINIIKKIPASVGSIIEFGGFSWLVLDVQDNHALVITEYLHTIGLGRYNNTPVGEGVTWSASFLRSHLNSEFLHRFSPSDRSRIRQTTVTNEKNPRYHTNGGPVTEDLVFILSIREVVRYFGDSGELYSFPTDVMEKMHISDEYNSARTARYADGRLLWGEGGTFSPAWWLRTPGDELSLACTVDGAGNIYVYGNGISNGTLGTRPVLWLNLDGA